jgi:hypothetical protein
MPCAFFRKYASVATGLLLGLACLSFCEPARACTVTITSTNPPAGQVGLSYSTQLTATGCNGSYTWSRVGGALPLGVSLNTSGIVSGTPALVGQYFVTIQAKDSSGTIGTAGIIFPVATAQGAVSASPSSLAFSGIQGGSNPAAQSVSVSAIVRTTFTVASDSAWLSASPTSSTTPNSLSVTAAVGALTVGTYSGKLTLTPTSPSGPPQVVSVTFTISTFVPPPAVLAVSTSSLSFSAQAGSSNPAAQSVQISNTGGGTLSFGDTNAQSWLTVSPSNGSAPATLTASVNIAGLQAGNYTDSIQVSAPGAQNSPQTVSVTLNLSAPTQSAASPVIFFTDLQSGPNTGGQSGQGTILTIYGKRFGASRGTSTVTVGGAQVATYLAWSGTKVSVSLGANAKTGNVVIGTTTGTSNGVPFTVRSGSIYCVSAAGRDANPGTFAGGCFATLMKARDTMQPGDITYAMDGVSQTSDDGKRLGAALTIFRSGNAGAPMALIAYPGAKVTIGAQVNGDGIEVFAGSLTGGQPTSHWVFGGLNLQGAPSAFASDSLIGASTDFRLVGNDLYCPFGGGESACAETIRLSNVVFYGNTLHDVSPGLNASKNYDGISFSTDSNHIDVGWNTLTNVQGCHGIQFNSIVLDSNSGRDLYDLHVHDNFISGTTCDGIDFATVDPSKGTVEAYNNVIVAAGIGPDPPDGASNYACIYSPGLTNAGTPGNGTIHVYNNTMYNCGSNTSRAAASLIGAVGSIPPSGGTVAIKMQNNIIFSASSTEPYIESGSTITGDHNLFFGNGAAPFGFSSSINANPLFVNPSGSDFHLQSASRAIGAGISVPGLLTDKDGEPRPQGSPFDLGAFESVP